MDIYRERIIELYKNPLNFGEIKNCDLKSEVSNKTCGDRIKLYIKLKGNKIKDMKFSGSGCSINRATASLVTEYLKGKDLKEIKKINKEKVLKLLGIDLKKNPSRLGCALLILDALKEIK